MGLGRFLARQLQEEFCMKLAIHYKYFAPLLPGYPSTTSVLDRLILVFTATRTFPPICLSVPFNTPVVFDIVCLLH